MISERSTVRAAGDLVSTDLAGEAIILDVKSATYFGLNEVGARIWELIQNEKPVAEICDVLLQEYDAPREDCLRDVLHLLHEMQSQGLVRIADEATA